MNSNIQRRTDYASDLSTSRDREPRELTKKLGRLGNSSQQPQNYRNVSHDMRYRRAWITIGLERYSEPRIGEHPEVVYGKEQSDTGNERI